MKNKIKKRLNDNKNNASGLVFLWTIFFVLVIACGALYLGKDSLINFFVNKKMIVDKPGMENDKRVDVDINSPNIQQLFDMVHRDIPGGDGVIYSNKRLDAVDMDDYYKFGLASRLYSGAAVINNYAAENEITAYIEEEKVKHYYEVLFGKDTYKMLDKIPYTCTDMYYDTVSRRYITTNQVCGFISPFSAYEKVISAEKDDKMLYITGAVVFSESYTGSLCKDYECKEVIDSYPSTISEKEYFHNYIGKNKDKLIQYTYRFRLADDGFYYYLGFERTKE